MDSGQIADLLKEMLGQDELTTETVSAIALLECARQLAIIAEQCSFKPRKPVKPTKEGKVANGISLMPRKQQE